MSNRMPITEDPLKRNPLKRAWDMAAMGLPTRGNWLKYLGNQHPELLTNPSLAFDVVEYYYPNNREFLDVIRQDPDLARSLHGAFLRSDGFASGIGDLMTGTGAGLNAESLQAMLQSSPQARHALIKALDNVDSDIKGPDGKTRKVTFADFKKFAETSLAAAETGEDGWAGKWLEQQRKDKPGQNFSADDAEKEKNKRTREALASMRGVGVSAGLDGLTPDQMLGFLGKMITDPEGALKDLGKLLTASGMDPKQVQAITDLAGPFMRFASIVAKPHHDNWQVHGHVFKAVGHKMATAIGIDMSESTQGPRTGMSASEGLGQRGKLAMSFTASALGTSPEAEASPNTPTPRQFALKGELAFNGA